MIFSTNLAQRKSSSYKINILIGLYVHVWVRIVLTLNGFREGIIRILINGYKLVLFFDKQYKNKIYESSAEYSLSIFNPMLEPLIIVPPYV